MDSSPQNLPLEVRIVEAIADELDVPSDSLEPLAGHFDPEALGRFVESATVPTRVTVELYGCTMELDAGDIEIRRNEVSGEGG